MEYDKTKHVFVIENDAGEEIEVPATREVCHTCDGKGLHVNRAIDGHGITMDEWNGPDWDDDSREGYLTGRYDVPCEECGGNNVVPVPDMERMTPEERALVETWQESEAEYRSICAMEARLGC